MATVPSNLTLVSELPIGAHMAQLRDGAHVSRWHVERLEPQRVSEHSHGVAVILCFICEPSANLLKASLFHDMAEKHSGDMPAPIKWEYPEFSRLLHDLENKVKRRLGLEVSLTDEEERLLKLADYLDASYYALEQRKSGNRYADDIFANLRWFFEQRTNLVEFPKAQAMWMWIKEQYAAASR
jgi:5'-deoxynucleotidase YfbR-like HD superfamily hydrolase